MSFCLKAKVLVLIGNMAAMLQKFALVLPFAVLLISVDSVFGGACDSIPFVSREEWGALPSVLTDMKLPVHHVFIHHTAQEECFNKTECSRVMRELQYFHNVTRDFGDVGYNFLIGGDGNVYVGRDWTKNGRHTKGMNENSVAFSLMGNYSTHLPSEKMLNLIEPMIKCGIERKVIAPDYQLHGHRDQVCTECPGDAFYNVIRKWPKFVPGPLPTYTCPYP